MDPQTASELIEKLMGNYDELKDYIQNKGNLNLADKRGITLLMHVARKGDVDAVNLLINAGAEIDTIAWSTHTSFGFTAFTLAAEHEHLDVCRVLFKSGADINVAQLREGATPLILAAKNNRVAMVDFLLANNAHRDISDNNGKTALEVADSLGHEDIVSAFIKHSTSQGDSVDTQLDTAIDQGYFTVARLLLKAGADVSKPDADGKLPLERAVRGKHASIAGALLEHGADITCKSSNGDSMPTIALSNNDALMVGQLCSKGFDVNAPDANGIYPLEAVIRLGHDNLLHTLKSQGLTARFTTTNGENMLILAAKAGMRKTVDWLLDKGADYKAKDGGGNTAHDCAIKNGHLDTANLLALAPHKAILKQEMDLKNKILLLFSNFAEENKTGMPDNLRGYLNVLLYRIQSLDLGDEQFTEQLHRGVTDFKGNASQGASSSDTNSGPTKMLLFSMADLATAHLDSNPEKNTKPKKTTPQSQ